MKYLEERRVKRLKEREEEDSEEYSETESEGTSHREFLEALFFKSLFLFFLPSRLGGLRADERKILSAIRRGSR